MVNLLQFAILFCAMLAAFAIGFWMALQRVAARQTDKPNTKVAQTIEQLRDQAAGAEADKSLSLIASDHDRERANAWRALHQPPSAV